MDNNFIGKGLQYPPQKGENGCLAIVAEEQRVMSNLMFLLSLEYNTVPGLEEVGSDLPNSLFDKLRDPAFLLDSLRRLITTYEKRVLVEDLLIDRVDQFFKLKIRFRIKGLGLTKDIEALVGEI